MHLLRNHEFEFMRAIESIEALKNQRMMLILTLGIVVFGFWLVFKNGV